MRRWRRREALGSGGASAALALGAAPTGSARAPTRRCSTSPTIRPASSIRSSTRRSPRTGSEQTGEDVTIQHVARRLRQAGARRDRRPRGRRRHAGARLRHRRDRRAHRLAARRTGSRACRTTARPTPRRSCSWCARATRRASRTGATWSRTGVQVITPNPEDLGRRALELPRRLGLRAAPARRQRRQGAGVRRRALQERAGARHRRPRLDHHLRPARHRRRAAGLGERGLPRARGARAGPVRDRRALAQHPGRAAGRRWSTTWSTSTAPAQVAEAYLEYLYSPTGQALAAKHYYRPVSAGARRARRSRALSRGRADHDRRGVRRLAGGAAPALRRRRRLRPDRHTVGSLTPCARCASSSRASCPGSG